MTPRDAATRSAAHIPSQLGRMRFRARVTESGTLTLNGLHGLWYNLWTPPESDEAHHAAEKPFSLVPWYSGDQPAWPGASVVHPGTMVQFEVAAWTPDLLDGLQRLARAWVGGRFRAGPVGLRGDLAGWETAPGPWAEPRDGASWTGARLRMVTPLSFRRMGIQYPLPDPEALFGSLQRRWALWPDLNPWRRCQIVRFRLDSAAARFNRYVIVGAVGSMELGFRDLAPSERTLAVTLLKLAEFSGVGYGTTKGLGVLRVTPVEEGEEGDDA
jgi:hypothetical protein